MIEHNGDIYATAPEAIQALRDAGQYVADDAVRDWRRRGLLAPVATLDRKPHYRMRDVWRVERDLREREDPKTRRAGRWRANVAPTAEGVDFRS
jgi:hypothetical protein